MPGSSNDSTAKPRREVLESRVSCTAGGNKGHLIIIGRAALRRKARRSIICSAGIAPGSEAKARYQLLHRFIAARLTAELVVVVFSSVRRTNLRVELEQQALWP